MYVTLHEMALKKSSVSLQYSAISDKCQPNRSAIMKLKNLSFCDRAGTTNNINHRQYCQPGHSQGKESDMKWPFGKSFLWWI